MAYNILIADDDSLSRKLINVVLSKSTRFVCDIDEAEDGISAWQMVRHGCYDLILLDWDLPGVSGLQVLKSIKDSKFRHIPVIVVTSKTSSEELFEAMDNGATDYIRKPIDRLELLSRTRAALTLHDSIMEVKSQHRRIETQIFDLNRLSLIIKKTDNGVMIFNSDGEIEWANEGFHKMYGYSFEEFKNRYGTNITSLSYNPLINVKLAELFESRHSVNYVTQCRVKYGATKWIQTTLTPIFEGDNIQKFIAIETDISQQKRIEMELERRNEETKILMQRVQAANEKLEMQQREILKQNEIIDAERRKTDDLLLNILPPYVVAQLKTTGEATPRNYKMATVMFTDFSGFTKSCENLSPDEIVTALQFFFTKFDDIISGHFIEKIKTIGDSYMCVGGIPLRNRSNPFDVVLAGLEIKHFMANYRKMYPQLNIPDWKLRIGIHTGALVAGVVGKIKFAYDTWGDTVNIAKRMESADEIGAVNISYETYKYIKNYFVCRHRGPVDIKNHKSIDMYFVDRIKPQYSADEEGIYPSEYFADILNGV